jgi:predicted Fe-Mo cluster-binding NifX family protein
MKVAIATENGQVSAHFGRCPNYTIFDVDVEDREIIEQTVIDTPPHQPGLLPKFLNEKGVDVVIAGGMGPRAQGFFTQMNIHPIVGISGAVDEVIQAYLEDKLVIGESLCDHGKPGHQKTCDHD